MGVPRSVGLNCVGRTLPSVTRFPQRASKLATRAQSVEQVQQQAAAPQRDPLPVRTAEKPQQITFQDRKQTFINVIPKSRWHNGIPPVMGAHLMASGQAAPISTSTGAGLGVAEHIFTYPKSEADASVLQYGSSASAAAGMVKLVTEASAKAIQEKGSFTIALTGGSLLKFLGEMAGKKDVDFAKWHVFFGDERNVPYTSPDSTYKGALEEFLSKVPIPAEQIHAIKEGLNVKNAAAEYAGQMLRTPPSILPRTDDDFPVLDLIILGLGPDGHICSLFPNRPQTAAKEGWVLSIDNSPKPPPERITFSMPVVNSAKEVLFVALGGSKAEIVQRVLEVPALPGALPAQMVRPTNGSVKWLLDADSAAKLALDSWDAKSFARI